MYIVCAVVEALVNQSCCAVPGWRQSSDLEREGYRSCIGHPHTRDDTTRQSHCCAAANKFMNFMRSLNQISTQFGRRAPSSCIPWSIVSQSSSTIINRPMASCSAAEKQPKLMQVRCCSRAQECRCQSCAWTCHCWAGSFYPATRMVLISCCLCSPLPTTSHCRTLSRSCWTASGPWRTMRRATPTWTMSANSRAE